MISHLKLSWGAPTGSSSGPRCSTVLAMLPCGGCSSVPPNRKPDHRYHTTNISISIITIVQPHCAHHHHVHTHASTSPSSASSSLRGRLRQLHRHHYHHPFRSGAFEAPRSRCAGLLLMITQNGDCVHSGRECRPMQCSGQPILRGLCPYCLLKFFETVLRTPLSQRISMFHVSPQRGVHEAKPCPHLAHKSLVLLISSHLCLLDWPGCCCSGVVELLHISTRYRMRVSTESALCRSIPVNLRVASSKATQTGR